MVCIDHKYAFLRASKVPVNADPAADLDETLVLTEEATEKAYIEVASLARALVPEVSFRRVCQCTKSAVSAKS